VNGTAGATLFDFAPDVFDFAAAAKEGGASVACELGANASETESLEPTGCVGAFCTGAGVEVLLVVWGTALSLTGSSDVCFGGCM
jgi:hypothetical protein